VRSCRVTTSRPSTRIWTPFASRTTRSTSGFATDLRTRSRTPATPTATRSARRSRPCSAVADLQHTIDAETPTTDLSDGTLAYETVFDATIPAEAVAVTATYGDGTTERVPDEYVTVDQEGIGPLSSTAIAIEEYPVPDGTEVADVRVQVAGADRLGESRERVASAALDSDLASLDAITVSTLDPGPDDRVTHRCRRRRANAYRRRGRTQPRGRVRNGDS